MDDLQTTTVVHFPYCAHCHGPVNCLTRLGAGLYQCEACGAVERLFQAQEFNEADRRFHQWQSRCVNFDATRPSCRGQIPVCDRCAARQLLHLPEAADVHHE